MKKWVVVLWSLFCGAAMGAGRAHLSVMVVDSESGERLEGIHVHGGFRNYPRGWEGGSKDNSDEETTDARGMCHLSGFTEEGHSCCIARDNEGFYDSGWYSFDYKERSLLKLGRWLPDDIVVTVRLDRVVNPIPLYVKRSKGKFRERNQKDYMIATDYKNLQKALLSTNDVRRVNNVTMAFDVVVGDWLPPFGGGNVADISFVFNEDVLGWKVAEGYSVSITKLYKMNLLMSFLGKGNGVVEIPVDNCAGIKIRNAPLEGYSPNLSRWKGWFGGGDGATTDCDKDRSYAFRIRTEYDDKGNIKSALYGKVYGDFDMLDIEGVRFLYYLNPSPNDRNLEWDMKHNLCPKPGDIGYPQP